MRSKTFYAHSFTPYHLSHEEVVQSFKIYYVQGKIHTMNQERITFNVLDLTKTVEIWRIASVQYKFEDKKLFLLGFEPYRSFKDQNELILWKQQQPYQFTREPINLVLEKGDDVKFRVSEFIINEQLMRAICLCGLDQQVQ